jgi:hypothetical protein
MIHVIKHDMDPNSNINYRGKIPPLAISLFKKVMNLSRIDPKIRVLFVS